MSTATNSLQGLESGKMPRRLAYAFFLAIGLLFLISAVITAFGIASAFMVDEGSAGFRYLLFFCYLALNLMIAYGFIFSRAWILSILGAQNIIMIALCAQQIIVRGTAPAGALGAVVFALLFLFAYKNKKLLNGPALKRTILVSFVALMLTTLLLTKTNLVY